METVIRLTPSPAFAGLIDVPEELVSKNLMLATAAQCCSARWAAPVTSLPTLMFGGGELSEREKATMMGFRSQRRATMTEAS